MKKVIFIIILIVLCIFGMIFILGGFKKRTDVTLTNYSLSEDGTKNSEEESIQSDLKGNTDETEKTKESKIANNKEEKDYSMKNGDRFVKIGDTIAYVDYDENIYMFNLSSKSLTKLCTLEDGVQKIYFDGEYIYAMPYYYRGKGVYKIDLQGNVKKIYEGASIQLWFTDENIYFTDQIGFDDINQTPQGNLCVMDKDGNNKKVVIENVKNYFKIYGDTIFYTDNDTRSLYKANIDGTDKKELAKGRTYITSATDQYVSYIDFSDGEKHRILYLDNMQNTEVGRFGNVCITENDIYFYTRKLIGKDNTVEDSYTLYKANLNEHSLEEIWKNEEPLEYLYYIYDGYGYFRGNSENYRVNFDSNGKSKETTESYNFFVGGKAYVFKSVESEITELDIGNLNDMKNEKIEF